MDPEDREDRIADELLDHPAVALHRGGHARERLVDTNDHVLGVELTHEARVVDDVGEEGGHDPPIARPRRGGLRLAGGEHRPALVAEASRPTVRRAAVGTAHPTFLRRS